MLGASCACIRCRSVSDCVIYKILFQHSEKVLIYTGITFWRNRNCLFFPFRDLLHIIIVICYLDMRENRHIMNKFVSKPNKGGLMINSLTQHEKISKLVEWYVSSFEKGRIALYVFPPLEKHTDFTSYLNSFISALRRADCRPVYSWSYDLMHSCYNLLLIVNGHFRTNMDDITYAAERIWQLYSQFPLQMVSDIPVSLSSLEQDKMNLFNVINKMEFIPNSPQMVLPSHQRVFACSKLQ